MASTYEEQGHVDAALRELKEVLQIAPRRSGGAKRIRLHARGSQPGARARARS